MAEPSAGPPSPPLVRLALAVTGHRAGHRSYAANEALITTVLGEVLDVIEAAQASAPSGAAIGPFAPIRLHTLLADGTDRLAASEALARGYELVAPLPFGRRLNRAINSLTEDPAEARDLLAGGEGFGEQTRAHAAAIRQLTDQARVFSLADGDEDIARLFLAKLDAPEDRAAAQLFAAECSLRVAQAGRILIEQSDLMVAVWDGVSTAHVGGTGETIARSLDSGVPVLWIDPARAQDWRILRTPEQLLLRAVIADDGQREPALKALIHGLLDPGSSLDHPGFSTLDREAWRPRSHPLAHGYRMIETLFGNSGKRWRPGLLLQHYASPDALPPAGGLAGGDTELAERANATVTRRFAWFDGVASRLSDTYRGGMTVNFLLSSLAISGGVSYLPWAEHLPKWYFASFELLLLVAVLLITITGQRRQLHSRWFETRRVAEHLRHAPLLIQIGAARALGSWPQATGTGWPEFYARQVLRETGLPRLALSQQYLHTFLCGPLADHVEEQRAYHAHKARVLRAVHHNLDHLSERLFQLAVLSVSLYLILNVAAVIGLTDDHLVYGLSKYFTVLGVIFPTFGAGIAGLRYFGDFERFSDISEVSAKRLGELAQRINLLALAPPEQLHYGPVADLVHAADEAVLAELESWQAVFGGKQITIPV